MFYDRFVELCSLRGVQPTRAALDMGLSKSLPTKWKQTGADPSGDTLNRLADYFNMSVDELLGNESNGINLEEQLKVALFGGDTEVTNEMWNEVKNFASFVVEREKNKK